MIAGGAEADDFVGLGEPLIVASLIIETKVDGCLDDMVAWIEILKTCCELGSLDGFLLSKTRIETTAEVPQELSWPMVFARCVGWCGLKYDLAGVGYYRAPHCVELRGVWIETTMTFIEENVA